MTDKAEDTVVAYPFLLERLALHAQNTPTKVALNFVVSGGAGEIGGHVDRSYTYKQLEVETSQLASTLLSSSAVLRKGDLVVLVYPPSLDFCVAFLACFKAGLVAIPVFPPNPARKDSLDMFSKIVAGCGAKVALTSKQYQHMKTLSGIKDAITNNKFKSSSAWPDLTWIVTDASPKKPHATLLPDSVNTTSSDVIAFLQYTSGSTSDPKGVMITQGNLAHNLHIITSELQASSKTTVVSWLPQYHDMGLIGSYLGILYCGGTGYYMSPLTFLQRPMIWIEAASKYHATHLQAPNFALKLCARKFISSDQATNHLDLSTIQHVINGAEPIDEESIEIFCTAFSPYGMRREVIFPTYGLAEHTVFVCSGGTQILSVDKVKLEVDGIVVEVQPSTEDTIRKVVGCGYPSKQNVDVRIVNPETCHELEEDCVGEIWISSPSKASGYYNKPVETQEDFHAQLVMTKSTASKDGYLRTGDLGFLHNNELFICGRRKDLIIVGGRNHYPQDIEATAEAASSLVRPGCCAAFSVNSSSDEEVALVVELRDVPPKQELVSVCNSIIQNLQSAIKREHSLQISHFVLLKPRTIPKTTSGKIARSWCRKAFLAKTLQSVYTKDVKVAAAILPQVDGVVDAIVSPLEVDSKPKSASVTAQEIRDLSLSEIRKRLKRDVGKLGQISPVDTMDLNAPLISLMDSLSISQLKGMLEVEYFTKLSDDYLFRETTTVSKLVEVVKLGYAPDDVVEDGIQPKRSKETTSSSGAGQARGVAGALGCPPGVVCTIL